jgi:hypothetical protein
MPEIIKKYAHDFYAVAFVFAVLLFILTLQAVDEPPKRTSIELVDIEVLVVPRRTVGGGQKAAAMHEGLIRGLRCPCPDATAWHKDLLSKRRLTLTVDKNSLPPYASDLQKFFRAETPFFVHKIKHNGEIIFERQASQ